MAAGRYVIVGSWSHESTTTAHTPDQGYAVSVDSATLRDTRTGHDYREGAWRVRIAPTFPGVRGKTFRGETAWSDATRYAGDIVHEITYTNRGLR